jgi:hypothetical protein
MNDFHSAFGNLLSDVDTKGNSDQIGILEFHTRTRISIIQNDIRV